jgi:putative acetyltransferase
LNLAQHSIRVVDPQGEDALSLLREAAIEARALYPELHTEGSPWPSNPSNPPGGTYVIAYELERPVACGALRPIDSTTVEVRRMYVLKSVRRSGLARKILVVLEASAARIGYKVMRLETGSRQHPAMALYESFGFERIAPFGEYVNDPTSICYEKAVARHADA